MEVILSDIPQKNEIGRQINTKERIDGNESFLMSM